MHGTPGFSQTFKVVGTDEKELPIQMPERPPVMPERQKVCSTQGAGAGDGTLADFNRDCIELKAF
ncbi:MAG TPA: hypothetical protein VIB00_03555 [Pyrinomonadaceae bacterium]|jgi:hypothetical protein